MLIKHNFERMINSSKEPASRPTETYSPIKEFGLSLLAMKDGEYYPSGTAMIITGHLAITAKHVIEDYWRHFEYSKLKPDAKGKHNLVAAQVQPEKKGALWTVRKIYFCPSTDIAFLELYPFSEAARSYTWKGINMNLFPPPVGSRVVGFGYHSSSVNEKDKTINWKDSPTTVIGEVMEIHPAHKDSGFLRFPCFGISNPITHGMSGGPIFNESGELCGLITATAYSAITNSIMSYAVSLWPIANTVINIPGENGITYKYAIDLMKSRILAAKNWEKITFMENPDGTTRMMVPNEDSL